MESTIGLFITELIYARSTGWQSRQEVETATAKWVPWFNRARQHSLLGYRTPLEIEMACAHQTGLPRQAALKTESLPKPVRFKVPSVTTAWAHANASKWFKRRATQPSAVAGTRT